MSLLQKTKKRKTEQLSLIKIWRDNQKLYMVPNLALYKKIKMFNKGYC